MNPDITRWANAHPTLAAGVAVVVALLLAAAAWSAVRALREAVRGNERPPAAVVVAALAAVACTAYSADTSWRFAASHLDMASTAERAAMFAAGELALFACALMARHNLRTAGAPGTPGLMVWGVTAVQVFAAYAEGGIVGGTVRAVLGPVLAAMLWHLAMGIELRHAKPGASSQSLPAIVVREVRERVLSRLGLATRGRDAEQITRDRWTVRAVALAARLSEVPVERRDRRSARRLARRLSVAVGRAQAGADEQQRRMLLELLAARRHAVALATITLPSPWHDDNQTDDHPATTEATTGPAALPRLVPVPVEVPIVPALEAVPLPRPAAVPAAETTNLVVTSPVGEVTGEMTPGQRKREARRLNREAIRRSGKPVTVDQLRTELGLSRRDAAELRRAVVETPHKTTQGGSEETAT